MNFCYIEPVKGDCLWLTAFVFRKIFKFKTIRFILLAAIVTQLFIYIFELSVFFIHPEYFSQYAPLLFARTYGFVAAIGVLLTRHVAEDLLGSFDKWPLDSVGDECLHELKRTIFASNFITTAVLGCGAFMGLFYFQNNRTDTEYFLIMFVFEQHCPKYSGVFNFSIKLLIFPIFFAMLVHVFLLAYGTQHILMQFRMWIVNFERIVDDRPGEYEEMADDERYQEEICRRLVFSIQRIVYFLEFRRTALAKLINPLFVWLFCSGYILGISTAMMTYESYQGTYEHFGTNNIILDCTFALLAGGVFLYLIYYGQQIENSSEHARRVLARTKWYYFNQRNKMIILMFWLILTKPIRMNFSTNLAVNHPFGLKMVKGLYSVMSLIIGFAKAKHCKC